MHTRLAVTLNLIIVVSLSLPPQRHWHSKSYRSVCRTMGKNHLNKFADWLLPIESNGKVQKNFRLRTNESTRWNQSNEFQTEQKSQPNVSIQKLSCGEEETALQTSATQTDNLSWTLAFAAKLYTRIIGVVVFIRQIYCFKITKSSSRKLEFPLSHTKHNIRQKLFDFSLVHTLSNWQTGKSRRQNVFLIHIFLRLDCSPSKIHWVWSWVEQTHWTCRQHWIHV